jgi:hypothetical protein
MSKLFFILTLFLVSLFYFSCTEGNDPGTIHEGDFGIYLVKNGELVISDRDIVTYNAKEHIINLNENGVNRMRSYVKWKTDVTTTIPQFCELYHQDFQVRLKNEVIYSGKFNSGLSSTMFEGIVIYDVVMITHENFLNIEYHNINAVDKKDPRQDNRIFNHFRSFGKFTE